jgi:hypothetical protein
VDISALDPDKGKNAKLQPQLEGAFAEAAGAEDLLLLTPPIKPRLATIEGD